MRQTRKRETDQKKSIIRKSDRRNGVKNDF